MEKLDDETRALRKILKSKIGEVIALSPIGNNVRSYGSKIRFGTIQKVGTVNITANIVDVFGGNKFKVDGGYDAYNCGWKIEEEYLFKYKTKNHYFFNTFLSVFSQYLSTTQANLFKNRWKSK